MTIYCKKVSCYRNYETKQTNKTGVHLVCISIFFTVGEDTSVEEVMHCKIIKLKYNFIWLTEHQSRGNYTGNTGYDSPCNLRYRYIPYQLYALRNISFK